MWAEWREDPGLWLTWVDDYERLWVATLEAALGDCPGKFVHVQRPALALVHLVTDLAKGSAVSVSCLASRMMMKGPLGKM